MHFGDFKVHIQEEVGRSVNRVFLYQNKQGYTVFLKNDGTAQTIKEGEQHKYDELWFVEMSYDQLHAFAEALANKGIKTNKDSIAEGKLQATERHLEDMRLIALHKFAKPTTPKEEK